MIAFVAEEPSLAHPVIIRRSEQFFSNGALSCS